MKRSTNRILTTHVGSLVRPTEIVQIIQGKEDGTPYTPDQAALIKRTVAEGLKLQAESGIDIPSDGEYSKAGFSAYVTDRLTGFEYRTDLPNRGGGTTRSRDRTRFKDAYAEIEAPRPGPIAESGRTQSMPFRGYAMCTGPISFRGEAAVQNDIDNFKAGMQGLNFEEAFIPAIAPATVELQRANHYYKTEEEFLFAIADAMKTEYKMIIDAGFVLQIDDPRIVTEWDSFDPAPTAE
ncbi:MAG TPA: hypothetical protein VJB57_13065, partial [Dehalococcoidia bacterium]|nr:hypothetical protein [Dehalococcoidia bacterium]